MSEEATAPIETPAEPVTTETTPSPANDTAAPGKSANDNAQPQAPTEAEFLGWVEKYGPEKALQIVAKKLNYTVDGTTLSVADYAAHREEKRKWKKETEQREREIADQLGKKVKESEAEIELGRALKRAHASGDYDGVAKALGVENWEALQGDFIKRLADPNHQRLIELERREQERERHVQQQREQYEQQQQHAQRQAAVQGYKQKMSLDMQNSPDSAVKELSVFPDVVEMLYAVQNEHYNRATNSTVTLEQAMDLPLPNGRGTPRGILRSWHDALSKAFKAAEPPPAPAPKAKGKTAPAAPLSPSQPRPASDNEWLRDGASRLEEAFKREAERERSERSKGNSQASQ